MRGLDAGIRIAPKTGVVSLGAFAELTLGQDRAGLARQVSACIDAKRDLGNGYCWLDLSGLLFAERAAFAGLCFFRDRLQMLSWAVNLRDGPAGSEWPTSAEIDAEVGFVRRALAQQIGFDARKPRKTFVWGEVWSYIDPKAGLASHGLRWTDRAA